MWKVMAIQQRLTGKFEVRPPPAQAVVAGKADGRGAQTLVQPSRKFVREGALQEKHTGKSAKLRYFFLFNGAWRLPPLLAGPRD
jgi:hypothetical protein